jgi:hypothetical protein
LLDPPIYAVNLTKHETMIASFGIVTLVNLTNE